MDANFFGYGSLVNKATHIYPNTERATLRGWRRVWKHTSVWDQALLSVEPAPGTQIDGLIAEVPGGDWAALDERESGYSRAPLSAEEISKPRPVQIYQVAATPADGPRPIRLSYLDVVVQGFLAEFGYDGVQRFFETTTGWDAGFLDDRAKPLYPRHQILTDYERDLVDQFISAF